MPDTPFIFVSGTIGEELAIDAMQRGAADYVFKDNLRRLQPAIERALERGRASGASACACSARCATARNASAASSRSTEDWIWEIDATGRCLQQRSVRNLLGCTAQEMLGRNCWS